ncbi:MAG: hypothetical protein JKY32_07805 [Rhizobiales bacterium]|nr:hypothetical protein [Hyphomicrobiales bacterium]
MAQSVSAISHVGLVVKMSASVFSKVRFLAFNVLATKLVILLASANTLSSHSLRRRGTMSAHLQNIVRTPAIKRQMRRRAAVEPVIYHIKNHHRMNRNYLASTHGDAINPILTATGYNFRLILKWIRLLWAIILWPSYMSGKVKSA